MIQLSQQRKYHHECDVALSVLYFVYSYIEYFIYVFNSFEIVCRLNVTIIVVNIISNIIICVEISRCHEFLLVLKLSLVISVIGDLIKVFNLQFFGNCYRVLLDAPITFLETLLHDKHIDLAFSQIEMHYEDQD